MKTFIPVLLIGAALAAGAVPVQAQEQQAPQSTPAPTQTQQVEAIAQEFINDLVAGDYQAALQKYDTTIRTNITAATLQQGWEDVIAASGAFQDIVGIQTQALDESADGSYVAIVTCQFENGTREFFVSLTGANRVVSINPAQ